MGDDLLLASLHSGSPVGTSDSDVAQPRRFAIGLEFMDIILQLELYIAILRGSVISMSGQEKGRVLGADVLVFE